MRGGRCLAMAGTCGHNMLSGRQVYGDRPKFFAKLVATYADGHTQTIVTDEQWKVHYGAMLARTITTARVYDPRLEEPGWNEPGLDAPAWLPVTLFDDPGIELDAASGAPVRTNKNSRPLQTP